MVSDEQAGFTNSGASLLRRLLIFAIRHTQKPCYIWGGGRIVLAVSRRQRLPRFTSSRQLPQEVASQGGMWILPHKRGKSHKFLYRTHHLCTLTNIRECAILRGISTIRSPPLPLSPVLTLPWSTNNPRRRNNGINMETDTLVTFTTLYRAPILQTRGRAHPTQKR